jgi:phosphoribosylformylglycinamidine (FGAM) synthase-like enzyme
MSAKALARLAEWHAAEAASTAVEAAITALFAAIETAENAWAPLNFGEARDAERDLRNLSEALWVVNYGR